MVGVLPWRLGGGRSHTRHLDAPFHQGCGDAEGRRASADDEDVNTHESGHSPGGRSNDRPCDQTSALTVSLLASSRFSSHLRRPRLSQQLELLVAVASLPSRCRRVSLPFLLFAFSSPAPTQSWSCSLTLAHPSHCRRLVAVSSPPSTRSRRLAQPSRLQWRVSADLFLFGF